MFFSDWLERRRIRKSFAKYLSPGVGKLIEENPRKYFGEPEEKHIQFLLVQIDDRDTAARIRDIGSVVQIVWKHNGTLGSILNVAFVYAFFGTPFPGTDTLENRMGTVTNLQSVLGDHVRIAHGECVALVGNFGGAKRMTWDALIPHFTKVLTALLATPFGAAVEVPDPGDSTTASLKP